MTETAYRCGFIAVVGRPNVGKSTLTNALIGSKITIVSRKAQTTRHRIQGVLTREHEQFVFVDTPGFQTRHGGAMNVMMNRVVTQTLADVDVVLFVVEAGKWSPGDAKLLSLLHNPEKTILVISKIDQIKNRDELYPFVAKITALYNFSAIVPVSANKKHQLDQLLDEVAKRLPENEAYFEADTLTDRPMRFIAAELIREKLFRLTGDELPYTSTVQIDKYEEVEGGRLNRIAATIIVERDAHKGMVIGEGGERLKRISTEARTEMERLTGRKVFLEVWVKVRSGWADDEKRLKSYGYE